jgi:hypothetical protein
MFIGLGSKCSIPRTTIHNPSRLFAVPRNNMVRTRPKNKAFSRFNLQAIRYGGRNS